MPPRAAVPGKVEYLTDIEFAQELGISVDALRAWRKQGKGPDYLKVEGAKGTVRYPRPWINEWAESHRVRVAESA